MPSAIAGCAWFLLVATVARGIGLDPLATSGLIAASGALFVAVTVHLVATAVGRAHSRLRAVNAGLERQVEARGADLGREIEAHARTEELLRQSDQRFRDVALAASDWIWQTGPDLRLDYVSPRFADLCGAPDGALLGTPAAEAFVENGELDAALAARRPFRALPVSLPSGAATREALLAGRPAFDRTGAFLGYRGTGTDVTEQRRAQAAQERLRQRHELILKSIGEGVFGFDRDGRITFINTAARSMLGWSAADLADRPVHETLHRAGARPCPLYAVLDGTAARLDGEALWCKDGRQLPVDMVCAPLAEDGATVGAVVVFHDMTERLKGERELREAKERAETATQAKSDFLAQMSHEMRTPLNAIIGFSDIILAELFGPIGSARYRDYVADVRRSGEHLLDLVDDILDLSKIEAGTLELSCQPVDAAQVVDSALSMLKPEAAKGGCSLVNNVAGNLPPLTADARRLKQVLLNLVSNGIKFTPSGGRVVVSAEVAGDGALVLKVADTGIGIREPDIARVLEAFGAGGDGRNERGAGLGLPLAKRLMELHGGRLEMASKVPGGTTVSLWFPPARLSAGAQAVG